MTTVALSVRDLGKRFGGGRTLLGRPKPVVHAVRETSFEVRKGETLGIVGESGCGKSTLARMLVGLLAPSEGRIEIGGRDLTDQTGEPAAFGRLIQYVFQDPISSLNPRKTVRQILDAPLRHLRGLDAGGRKARIAELLDAVNLRAEFLDRYPHEFSGGQAQRIGLARALAASPQILVLDEPVSALDVSVQAQVLNLLADLRREFELTYLFISHDLAVIDAVSERIAVLYFGRIVEIGPAERIFAAPRHPHTHLLASSPPTLDPRAGAAESSAAELPDPLRPPRGCAFAARCPRVQDDCRRAPPPLIPMDDAHEAACLHPLE
jgi:oligopeptide/dipeptide ABC transporter ATP-binding protein